MKWSVHLIAFETCFSGVESAAFFNRVSNVANDENLQFLYSVHRNYIYIVLFPTQNSASFLQALCASRRPPFQTSISKTFPRIFAWIYLLNFSCSQAEAEKLLSQINRRTSRGLVKLARNASASNVLEVDTAESSQAESSESCPSPQ